ncbi:Sugar transport protein 13 [Platanthera zijinensis]|uniref:Sugar transport protein 13 n=1 Tax=Platanthera zijinensis TaxID=2320716 RepID=A0AAP0BSP1_9ASPA
MDSAAGAQEDGGKITFHVLACSILAATGGLLFGYDVGISGGVTAMEGFEEKFFPEVYRKQQGFVDEDNYCKYDNQRLQLFTSSLYMACLLGSLVASRTCTKYGRKLTIRLAAIFYLAGVLLAATAANLTMLILGRLLVGVGNGFSVQAVPLFLSEIAPSKARGALNILFQLNITIGILNAKTVNYFAAKIQPWGWRLSLAYAGVPGAILFLGSLAIAETPSSLIQRGHFDQGLAVLRKIRGIDDVGLEYTQIVNAGEAARRAKRPFRKLLGRSSRPELVIAVALQVFNQLTGINVIMFYAPILFETVGFKSGASLLSTVIIGGINVAATVVSIVLVDRAGRRVLLLEACVQMFITQAAIGGILMAKLTATNRLETSTGICVVILVCLFVMSFAWSLGPLCSLIPSEIFPLETRTAGIWCSITTNMIFTFLVAQSFLSMLCRLKAAAFFFFAFWTVLMGLFVLILLPETKGVPIDEMAERVWGRHWYWKKFADAGKDIHTTEAAVVP